MYHVISFQLIFKFFHLRRLETTVNYSETIFFTQACIGAVQVASYNTCLGVTTLAKWTSVFSSLRYES